ncbi:glucose-6-phosphate isomerase [Neorhodopirellula lusitana]|uniref:Glucose-6-phosphate isomerase n=1 Tax=Neorhodopirellula lusitana TaxID=445327 RepID=A0ABY1Q5X2_9BACT|nr:glucose-6-phosphate isomerase [Neorhodopirellula lusitana]SMP56680.1 glucose-6-phosphate isomerase [Neorhodopirellula lusitana]
MSMLRFHASGAMHPEYGITQDQLDSLSGRLVEACAGFDEGFFRLPEQQLEAYAQKRERSELGRIFHVANGLHEHLDAVVVLGSGGSTLGNWAITQACCDPYHNELSRALRGSKPRMYFGGNDFDNDAADSLLKRLQVPSDGVTQTEGRYALIVNSPHGDRQEWDAAFQHFLAGLETHLGDEAEVWLPRLVIPVTGTSVGEHASAGLGADRVAESSHQLREMATHLGCKAKFTIPESIDGRFSALSPVGLLPAAFLGLDCMKLLEGAAAMNEHFRTTPYPSNIVMQFVAVHSLLSQYRGKSTRVLNVWSQALQAIGQWYAELHSACLEECSPVGNAAIEVRVCRTRHLAKKTSDSGQPSMRSLDSPVAGHPYVHTNLVVESWRTDTLIAGSCGSDPSGLNDRADETFPSLMAGAIQETRDALHANGHPSVNLVLPRIDTFVLGQLMQMWMIATAVERRLLATS